MKLNVVLNEEDTKILKEIGKSTGKPYSSLVRGWINRAYSEIILNVKLTQLPRIEALETELKIYKNKLTKVTMDNEKILKDLDRIFAKGEETEKEFAIIIKEEEKKKHNLK